MISSLYIDLEQKGLAIILDDLLARQSHKLHGLPPHSPLVAEGNKGETMDQPTTIEYHVEGVLVIEFGKEFSSYENPLLVQQTSTEDMTFHFQTEGQPGAPYLVFNHPSDDTVVAEFGSTAPFWNNSIG